MKVYEVSFVCNEDPNEYDIGKPLTCSIALLAKLPTGDELEKWWHELCRYYKLDMSMLPVPDGISLDRGKTIRYFHEHEDLFMLEFQEREVLAE